MTYDLIFEQPCEIDIRPNVETERGFLPGGHTLKNTLLLADAGYFDLTYFKQVMGNGGYFMVKANKTINPTVLSAFLCGVNIGEKGTKLQSLLNKFGSQALEMTVSWKKSGPEYRQLYTPDKNRPLLLLTNLSKSDFHFDQLLDIYAARWQIELFFKELKSWNNLKGFMTRDPNIAKSLIWLSLLLVFIKRFICHGANRMCHLDV
ncbi:hypothetical protein JL49_11825 [Pseudoalteromonas luteoviolacea]|nr:hypothetical protein JL49_11825 [Pseudoalteromonas luteoviolacea]